MRITSKGQVTIPLAIREQLGLLAHTEVEFEVRGTTAHIRKVRRSRQRGQNLIAHLRARGSVQMTTDEILALTRDS